VWKGGHGESKNRDAMPREAIKKNIMWELKGVLQVANN
jgi:hypothetical protein